MSNSRLRVLMVSTSYPADLEDWRGLFIRHIVDALSRDSDVQLNLWAPPGEIPADSRYVANSDERDWLAQLMQAGGIAHLMRLRGLRAIGTPFRLLRMLRSLYLRNHDIDILHVNWLQNVIPLPRNETPLLVTVLGSDLALLRITGMIALIRRAFHGRRVCICPNAAWMVPRLERHFGDLARVRHVPFGIDPCWYEIERNPVSPSRWLCVSRLTEGKIGTLFSWGGRAFSDTNRELHLFGPMQELMMIPDWVHYHGPASPRNLCQNWFPTARGLVSLSNHAEGLPQVMLEAMAATMPIVASRISAHEDLIQQGSTGWLCDGPADFCTALEKLDDDRCNLEFGQRARAFVTGKIGTWDNCAARYAEIYRELSAS
jgi:glycosyltransferase involved in cell wall biosynthesis